MLEKIEMKIGMFFTSIMPYKDHEKQLAWFAANKEKKAASDKAHYERNKEKYAAQRITADGRKKSRITNWKQSGVVSDDFLNCSKLVANL